MCSSFFFAASQIVLSVSVLGEKEIQTTMFIDKVETKLSRIRVIKPWL
jgi:hypothetical protein